MFHPATQGLAVPTQPTLQVPLPDLNVPVQANEFDDGGSDRKPGQRRISASGQRLIYQKGDKWEVQFKRTGTTHYLGRFPTKESAADALAAYERGETPMKPETTPKVGSTGVKGVRKGYKDAFVARGQRDGKSVYLGTYKTLEEASEAVAANARGENVAVSGARGKPSASGVKGISARGDKWRVNGTRNKERIYIGQFPSKEEAEKALQAFEAGEEPADIKRSANPGSATVAPGIRRITLKTSSEPVYQVNIKRDGKPHSLGNYESKEAAEAAIADFDNNNWTGKPKWKRSYGTAEVKGASGILGVTKRGDSWRANIRDDAGARIYLGTFKNKDDAVEAIASYERGDYTMKGGSKRAREPRDHDNEPTAMSNMLGGAVGLNVNPMPFAASIAVPGVVAPGPALLEAVIAPVPQPAPRIDGQKDAIDALTGLGGDEHNKRARQI